MYFLPHRTQTFDKTEVIWANNCIFVSKIIPVRKKINKILSFVKVSLSLCLLGVYFFLLVYSCASPGRPSGGLYDETPPRIIRSNPAPNSVGFTGKKIELNFDEYISLEKANENVIITPPQMQSPIIKGVGKKVTVELKDTLLPNTTYTFDFTNTIVDNNEKNILEGFTFAFSTGDIVDSMVISGLLLNARNLEPMSGILVGLHNNPEDSAFTTLPFNRTSKTDESGKFWIRNITPGEYHLFALEDQNRNYKYDFPVEGIAFEDFPVIPDFIPDVRMDTIWKDSLIVDTIHQTHYNRFIPDDLVLYYFTDNFTPQYFSKSERPHAHQFTLHFNSDAGFPPSLHLINNQFSKKDGNMPWYIAEYSTDKKSITYWLTDSLIYQQDSLTIKMDHMVHDSLLNLVSRTDTLQLNLRKSSAPQKGKDKEDSKIDFLSISLTPVNATNIFDTIKITFSEPLWNLDPTNLKFKQKVDTLWEDRQLSLVKDTLNPRLYYIENEWNFGQEFSLTIDSAKIYSIYNKWNDSIFFKWSIQPESAYGDIYVRITGNDYPGFGELLDPSEKIIRTSSLYNGELIFENLKPGKYYLRYIDDENENARWDSGNYALKKQPEKVYYFKSAFQVQKLYEFTENWNIKERPRSKQKPLEITKNKPKEKKPKRNEQQNTTTGNPSSSSQGGQFGGSSGSGFQPIER